MLRLVEDGPKGQDPPKGRKRRPILTDEENRHLRATLHNLRRAFGMWKDVARATGIAATTLCVVANGGSRGSGTMAVRAAQAAGLLVEVVLGHRALNEAGNCPHCGTRIGELRAVGGAS